MPRIVSLIASATEIVHALGLSRWQVGRSHECDYPEGVRALPVCTAPAFPVDGDSREIDRLVKETLRRAGSVYHVFEDVLERLAPTHLITQSQCRVCAVSAEDVERALSAGISTRPSVVTLEPNSLSDVWRDIRRVARALEVQVEGDELVGRLQARMETIQKDAAAAGARPTVAVIEWLEPLMAAGNWAPELVERAGGVNLFGKAGEHSGWLAWEELAASDPDVILAAPCGFDLERTWGEMHWLEQRPDWRRLKAVREGRVYLADGNQYFNRPGPRLVESMRILAEVLHPEAFAPDFEGRAWIHRAAG